MNDMSGQFRLASVATLLEELGHEIEALGATLCGDPAFAAKHIAELQAIDLIAQKQHAIAGLLSTSISEDAVNNLHIEALKDRLS